MGKKKTVTPFGTNTLELGQKYDNSDDYLVGVDDNENTMMRKRTQMKTRLNQRSINQSSTQY